MKLLINIPAFNEEQLIEKTIQSLPKKITGFSEVKIQVVNDGSTDKTKEKAKKAGVDYIISKKINRGLGLAFRTAVLNALEENFDVLVNIDADGQFDPEDIPRLVRPILENKADIVIGSRFSSFKPKEMPVLRKLLNQAGAKIVGLFLGQKTEDLTCGFRAYNKEAMFRLNLNHQFTYTQETIIDAISKNLVVIWKPVHVLYFKNRQEKMTKSIPNFIFQSLLIILKTLRDTKPLKFFGLPGSFLIGSSAIVFFVFFIRYLETMKISPFRNWIMLGSILLFLGIQFFILALLTDMIKSNRKITEDEMYERRRKLFKTNKKES